jgi:hypothetical protein
MNNAAAGKMESDRPDFHKGKKKSRSIPDSPISQLLGKWKVTELFHFCVRFGQKIITEPFHPCV